MVINFVKTKLSPHISVKNLNRINFEYLKNELGIKVFMLDKDDTFTIHHTHELSPHIKKETIERMIKTFGSNIKVLSNYEKDYVMDWKYEDLEKMVKESRSFERVALNT